MFRLPKTWTDFSALRWSGVDRPESRIGKLKLTHFAREYDLPYLDIVRTFQTARDISLSDIGLDCFVLKAASLWSGMGIYVLHKVMGTPFYYDVKNKTVWTEEKLRQEAQKLEKKIGKEIQFFIEYRALDENQENIIPLDYKLFTFYGNVKLIVQVNRNTNPVEFCFFDGNFSPIMDERVFIPKDSSVAQGKHEIPSSAAELILLAQEVTKKLKATFISVDCYATTHGAVLGELTHTPGGPWFQSMYAFSEEFELELGAAWGKAYHELSLDIPELSVPFVIELKGKKYRTID